MTLWSTHTAPADTSRIASTRRSGASDLRKIPDAPSLRARQSLRLGCLGDDQKPALVACGPGSGHEVLRVLTAHGEIQQGLARVLQVLLTDPVLKNATTMAIIRALQESGAANFVQMMPVMGCDDPDCPFCAGMRDMEGRQATTKLH